MNKGKIIIEFERHDNYIDLKIKCTMNRRGVLVKMLECAIENFKNNKDMEYIGEYFNNGLENE